MQRMTKGFLYLTLMGSIFLSGCNSSVSDEDIFQYKDSYVGDNSTVGNILRHLPSPNGESGSGFELKTQEEPYGIILNYEEVETIEAIEKNNKETALYNATFLLALVKNADWVVFDFVEEDYKITRKDLQDWYKKELREFQDEEELNSFIQAYIEDEKKVLHFFNSIES